MALMKREHMLATLPRLDVTNAMNSRIIIFIANFGFSHYVQMVNTLFAIFDKEGGRLVTATAIGALFEDVDGCSGNAGDPIGKSYVFHSSSNAVFYCVRPT